MIEDRLLLWGSLITGIHSRNSALSIAYKAIEKTITELSANPWYDPEAARRDNKEAMKQLGGALFSLRDFADKMTLIGIAKSSEGRPMLPAWQWFTLLPDRRRRKWDRRHFHGRPTVVKG